MAGLPKALLTKGPRHPSRHHGFHTDVYRACMSRNRDENGNGRIDADEVKWYLATVDQYKGLWIGEDLLPPAIHAASHAALSPGSRNYAPGR